MTQLSIIAGLGNPDDKYEKTLHNAGFWFVDALAKKFRGEFRHEKKFDAEVCRIRVDGADIRLLKPQSYMNLSGGPIRAALEYYRLDATDMLVAHDDIDLPPGTVRLKQGGGHGGHNGIRDVIRHCGADFLRLRLGVGHPGQKDEVTGHVLQRAAADVEAAVEKNIGEAVAVLPILISNGLNAAMKELHTREA
jgi:PTH1 family peptidyl-tRNA hydrolase